MNWMGGRPLRASRSVNTAKDCKCLHELFAKTASAKGHPGSTGNDSTSWKMRAWAALPSVRQSKQLLDPWEQRQRDVCIPFVLLSPCSPCRLSRVCTAMSPCLHWACSCTMWSSPPMLTVADLRPLPGQCRHNGASACDWQDLRKQKLARPRRRKSHHPAEALTHAELASFHRAWRIPQNEGLTLLVCR